LVVGVVALRSLRPRRAGGPSQWAARVITGPWPTKPARRSARRDGSQREPFHQMRPCTAGARVPRGWNSGAFL